MKKAVFLALLLLVCFASVNAADGKKEGKDAMNGRSGGPKRG